MTSGWRSHENPPAREGRAFRPECHRGLRPTRSKPRESARSRTRPGIPRRMGAEPSAHSRRNPRTATKTATVAKGPGDGGSFPDSGRADQSECGAQGAKLAEGGAKGMGSGLHGIAAVRPIHAPYPFDSATSDDPARRSVFAPSWRALSLGERPLVRSAGCRRASASAKIPVPSLQCQKTRRFAGISCSNRARSSGGCSDIGLQTGRVVPMDHGKEMLRQWPTSSYRRAGATSHAKAITLPRHLG